MHLYQHRLTGWGKQQVQYRAGPRDRADSPNVIVDGLTFRLYFVLFFPHSPVTTLEHLEVMGCMRATAQANRPGQRQNTFINCGNQS